MSASDVVALTHLAIVESGERVEAVDEWLNRPLFKTAPKPEDLDEWANDPAWLAEQEATMKALGIGT